MITGKTSSGFEFTLEDSAIDNWELLEMLSDIDSGNGALIVKALPMALGTEQYNALKAHMRESYKRIPASAMIKAFSEIMDSTNQAKK